MSKGLNHTIISDLELALIEGTEAKALCGILFVPHLRVGSGGRADNPALDKCPDCATIDQLVDRVVELKDARNRAMRELRAVEQEVRTIFAKNRGVPISEAPITFPSPPRHVPATVPDTIEHLVP